MSQLRFSVWLLDEEGDSVLRQVIINGEASNRFTGDTILIEPGQHLISLAPPLDFTPSEQEIPLTLDDPAPKEAIFYQMAALGLEG